MHDLFTTTRHTPTDEQRAAIESPERRILVSAGPGSGKTFSMIERGLWLLETGKVSLASEMLFLTFTVKAAEEIRNRFEALGFHGVNAYTFHGWAYHLLSKYDGRIHYATGGLSFPFTVLDEVDQAELLTEILKDYGWKMKPAKVSKWLNGGLRDEDVPKLPAGVMEEDLQTVRHEYERRKVDSNAVDFAGLLLLAHHIMTEDPDFLTLVQRWYRAVFVDEFQDTDGSQFWLVLRLIRPQTYLCMVGDADQSIYGWRDADPRLMVGHPIEISGVPRAPAAVALPEGTPSIPIAGNRRCAAAIVKGSRRLIEGGRAERMKKDLRAIRDEDGEVRSVCIESGEEKTVLPELAREYLARGTVAVLTRTNMAAGALGYYLRSGGVEAYVPGEQTDASSQLEARPVVYLLRVLANRYDRWSLLRAATHLSETGKLPEVLIDFIRAENPRPAALLKALGRSGWEWKGLVDAIHKIQGEDDGPQKLTNALTLARTALGDWSGAREAMGTWGAAWAARGGSLAAFLFHASIYGDDLDEADRFEEQVWVSTVHKAKGREFDTVIFSGFEEHVWNDERDEEVRRVAYVAMTRARHALIFTWRKRGKVWGEWKDLKPSRWLGEAFPGIPCGG